MMKRWWRRKQSDAAGSTEAASPVAAWWQSYTSAHCAHTEMVPRLKAHQVALSEATIALSGLITWQEQACRTYRYDMFGRLLEFSGSAVLALQHQLYAGALSQALLLLEQVIDLRYALFADGDLSAARLAAKQRQVLADADQRVSAWQRYARQEDAIERDLVQQRQQFLQTLHVLLSVKSTTKAIWPSLQLRARAVGFEKLYHYLFAGGVSATAQLDERMSVLSSYVRGSGEQRAALLEAWEAERASHAVFITAHALAYYCTTMRDLMDMAQQGGASCGTGKLERVSNELRAIVVACENTHTKFKSPPPETFEEPSAALASARYPAQPNSHTRQP